MHTSFVNIFTLCVHPGWRRNFIDDTKIQRRQLELILQTQNAQSVKAKPPPERIDPFITRWGERSQGFFKYVSPTEMQLHGLRAPLGEQLGQCLRSLRCHGVKPTPVQ